MAHYINYTFFTTDLIPDGSNSRELCTNPIKN